MLVGKWRGWHGRSFPWLKTFHFHIALPQIEHLSLFSFCIWLSSVPNLKGKKNARIPFSLWSVPSEGIKTFPTLWQVTFKGHHREKDSKFTWGDWVITLPLTKVWQKSVLSRSIYMITRKFGEIKFSGVARADAVGNNFHINQRWTEGPPVCLLSIVKLQGQKLEPLWCSHTAAVQLCQFCTCLAKEVTSPNHPSLRQAVKLQSVTGVFYMISFQSTYLMSPLYIYDPLSGSAWLC